VGYASGDTYFGTLGGVSGAETQTLTAAQMPLQTTGTESVPHNHSTNAGGNAAYPAVYADSAVAAGTLYSGIATGLTAVINWFYNAGEGTGSEIGSHTHAVGNATPGLWRPCSRP